MAAAGRRCGRGRVLALLGALAVAGVGGAIAIVSAFSGRSESESRLPSDAGLASPVAPVTALPPAPAGPAPTAAPPVAPPPGDGLGGKDLAAPVAAATGAPSTGEGRASVARGPAQAGMYRYTDEKGEVHFVDSADKIPEAYREEALSQPAETGQGGGEVTVVPEEPGAVSDSYGEGSASGDRPGRKKTCVLRFPAKDKKDDGKTVVYFGSVANRGTGTARVVQVTLETFDREGQVIDTTSAFVRPKDIPPSQSSSFEIVIDAGKRDRQTKNVYYYGSRFKTSYARCD